MKKILTLLCVFIVAVATGQTTTSSIKGIVKSSNNELLPGATILAMHTPTGSKYSSLSNEDGRFNILNMRIGGPYKILVTFVGYQNQEYNDVYLDLGKAFNLDVVLNDESQTLEEVKIVSKDKVFKSGKTGAETTIGRRELTALPTISRSAEDFTRLEPTASGGSFGGRNDQYNSYSLNGAVFNNPFGLDAATPGGQTGAQPISLDAIEQIQVATAPYDVTLSGFTGASVNAVTKSGTNEFHGTAYAFYRNQDLTGSKIKGEKIFVPSLEQTQAGFSLGAPIIKDKLFIFGNFEIDKRSDLGSNFVANNNDGVTGINESRVLESDLIAVSNALANLGYNTGAYQGFIHESNSSKGIIKVDWNINDNHKLAVIYNFLDASKDKPAHPTALGFRGPNASILQFQNSGYQINNKLSSFLLELNSKFSESVSNKLQAGYTHFNDYRDPFSTPAPVINIQDGAGSNYIIAGHEPFSINNTLDQKVIQITDNLNYTVGKHSFTFGSSFEKFKFANSFNLGGYDNFGNPNGYAGTFFTPYFTTQDFLDDAAKPYATSIVAQNLQYAQDTFNAKSQFAVGSDGGWKLAELNVGQLAFYAQDDFSVTEDFKLSLGLRIDKPLYFNTADLIQKYIDTDNGGAGRDNTIDYYDPDTGEAVKLISTNLPSDKILWSPRIGFNWDVKGNATSQLRGGSGIFTGRIPFVWLGNQVSGADDSFFQIMDPDYKWPQVWRTSLGYDHKFESNYILTFDFSYNKDINGVQVQNWGLKDPTGTLGGVDGRLIYTAGDKGANNAYVMTNSDKGFAFNATVKVQKNFNNGLYASLAYNYLTSKDVNSIEAEITGDAFAFNPALGNVNNDVLSNSKYGDNHRFIGVASKKWKYGNNDKWASTVSAFFEYAQGGRFSYTYGGDINNDGSAVNDLIYVPTTAEIGQMAFTGVGQGEAFEKYIEQDKYLKTKRGQYADRYGAISPWRGRCDFKFLQDYNFKVSSASEKKNTIQFSVDVLNLGNLINSDWGVVQVPTSVQPIGVTVVGNTPTYTFTNTQTKTFSYDASLTSRWQMQFGIRYIF